MERCQCLDAELLANDSLKKGFMHVNVSSLLGFIAVEDSLCLSWILKLWNDIVASVHFKSIFREHYFDVKNLVAVLRMQLKYSLLATALVK